jgi:hypothetical protein
LNKRLQLSVLRQDLRKNIVDNIANTIIIEPNGKALKSPSAWMDVKLPTPVPEPNPKLAQTLAYDFKLHLRVGLTLGHIVLLTRATNGPLPHHLHLVL